MRVKRHIENGSFLANVDELVPLLGSISSATRQSRGEAPTAVAGPRGSAAYHINQYLYDRSRHWPRRGQFACRSSEIVV